MDRSGFLLSAQHALLGVVTSNLRSVSGSVDGNIVRIRYLIDGEVDEATREELACASTRIIADTVRGWMLEEEFVRLDAPASLRGQTLPWLVYERLESAT